MLKTVTRSWIRLQAVIVADYVFVFNLPKSLPLLKTPLVKPKIALPAPAKIKRGLFRDRVDNLYSKISKSASIIFTLSGLYRPLRLYPHEKAIRIRNSYPTAVATLDDDHFFDDIYATLTSWRMHKLYQNGLSLATFRRFDKALLIFRRTLKWCSI